MRILVTGSEGGIGSRLAARLREEGHTVKGMDQQAHAEICGDLRDYPTVLAAVEGVDAVAHLGAIPSPRAGQEEAVLASNAQGTWNVLLACVHHGVKRAVCYSSVNAFGSFGGERRPPYLPGDDVFPAETHNVYQLAKHLVEEIGEHFVRNHGMTVLCPRPVFVARPEHYPRWREWFNDDPDSHGSQTDLFSYVDVRDVCDATIRALTLDLSGFASFLLTADDTTSLLPTEELVRRHYPDVSWRVSKDAWLEQNPHRSLVDCRVAKTLLGWQPRHSWRDGA